MHSSRMPYCPLANCTHAVDATRCPFPRGEYPSPGHSHPWKYPLTPGHTHPWTYPLLNIPTPRTYPPTPGHTHHLRHTTLDHTYPRYTHPWTYPPLDIPTPKHTHPLGIPTPAPEWDLGPEIPTPRKNMGLGTSIPPPHPRKQNDWQMPVKLLPAQNYCFRQ